MDCFSAVAYVSAAYEINIKWLNKTINCVTIIFASITVLHARVPPFCVLLANRCFAMSFMMDTEIKQIVYLVTADCTLCVFNPKQSFCDY
jgi:hypothetical protein